MPIMICPICKTTYTGRADKKYCSNSCRFAAYQEKLKEMSLNGIDNEPIETKQPSPTIQFTETTYPKSIVENNSAYNTQNNPLLNKLRNISKPIEADKETTNEPIKNETIFPDTDNQPKPNDKKTTPHNKTNTDDVTIINDQLNQEQTIETPNSSEFNQLMDEIDFYDLLSDPLSYDEDEATSKNDLKEQAPLLRGADKKNPPLPITQKTEPSVKPKAQQQQQQQQQQIDTSLTLTIPNEVYAKLEDKQNQLLAIKNALHEQLQKLKEGKKDVSTKGKGLLVGGLTGLLVSKGAGFWWRFLLSIGGAAIGNYSEKKYLIKTQKELNAHIKEITIRIQNMERELLRLASEKLTNSPFITVSEKSEIPRLNIGDFGLSALPTKSPLRNPPIYTTKHSIKKDVHFKSDKIKKAKDVLHTIQNTSLLFDGDWKEFLGTPDYKFSCNIYGMPGSGKSHLALQLGKYLAERFGIVVYVSGEEGFSSSFQEKLKTAEADVDNFYALDVKNLDGILSNLEENEANFIIVDSLNYLNINEDGLLKLKERYPYSSIIAISQSTKDGKMRGSNEINHEVDIVIRVIEGFAETTKNRFRATPKWFDVFKIYKNE